MHLAQELLTNIQCRVVQDVLQRRREPWRRGAQWPAIRSWQWQLTVIVKADPPTTIWEVAKELNMDHSMVVWHLKSTGKMKKFNRWVPDELTANQKIFILKCCLLLFYTTTMNHFSIGLWCATKSGLYTAIGDNRLSGWIEKKLQSTSQSATCTN